VQADSAGVIDLRSDVVTPPTEEMWEAMRSARPGWALIGEDPSVNELVELGARLVGKEAALFVPTCSMANLLALLTLSRPGERVILEAASHLATTERGGVEHLAGLIPCLVAGHRGVPAPAVVAEALGESHGSDLPPTSLLCLENTHNNAGGVAVSPEQTAAVAAVAQRHGVSVHLDGARLFNAAVALGLPAERLARPVDTVAISLNKGLSAPEGALLCGPRSLVDAARRHAEHLGATSLHKAGLAAAAGVVALRTMVDRLADDHRRAYELASRLAEVSDVGIDLTTVQTNIVLIDTRPGGILADELVRRLARRGILAMARSPQQVRFVTHRLIGDREIERTSLAVSEILHVAGVSQ